jgi:hypothetical protein
LQVPSYRRILKEIFTVDNSVLDLSIRLGKITRHFVIIRDYSRLAANSEIFTKRPRRMIDKYYNVNAYLILEAKV